jgi:hypothetical protein
VVLDTGLADLVAAPPSPDTLTHLFIDPWAVRPQDPRSVSFHQLRARCPRLWCLYYKFLFMKVRQQPEPSESSFSIFEPTIQEQGERDLAVWQRQQSVLRAKRAAEGAVGPPGKRTRGPRGEVLPVESSEEEGAGEAALARLRALPITVVGQAGAGPGKEVELSGSESEDDVQVLEQQLDSARQSAGHGRQYLDRGKATGLRRMQVTRPRRTEPEDGPAKPLSQREEFLRQQRAKPKMPNQKEEYLKQMEREKGRDQRRQEGKHRKKRNPIADSSSSSSSSSASSDEELPASQATSDSVVTLDDSEADSDMLRGPLLEVVKDGGRKERRPTKERTKRKVVREAPSEVDAGKDSDEERRRAASRKAPECINLDDSTEDEEEIVDAFSCADGSPDLKSPGSVSTMKLLEIVPAPKKLVPKPLSEEEETDEEIVEVVEPMRGEGTDPEDEIQDGFTEDARKDVFDDVEDIKEEQIDIEENDIICDTPKDDFEDEEEIFNKYKSEAQKLKETQSKERIPVVDQGPGTPKQSADPVAGLTGQPSRCPLCSFVPPAPSRRALYGHLGSQHFRREILAEHGASLSCRPCSRDFLTSTALVHHLASTHGRVEAYLKQRFWIPESPKKERPADRVGADCGEGSPPLVVRFNRKEGKGGRISSSMRKGRVEDRRADRVGGRQKDSGWVLERSPEKSPRGGPDPFSFEDSSPERIVLTLRRSAEQVEEEPARPRYITVGDKKHLVEELAAKARTGLPLATVTLARMSRAKFTRVRAVLAEYDQKMLAFRPPQLTLEEDVGRSSSALVFRLIGALQRRFQQSRELSAVGKCAMPYVAFDSHGEGEREARLVQKQVPNSVEMDFAGYFKSANTAEDKVGYFRESTLTTVEEELSMMDGVTSGDSVTSIRRLRGETASTAFPSSKMLNIVMRSLLLEEKDYSVLAAAHSYLCSFLFLHLRPGGKDRTDWLLLVLSAFRNLEQEKLFKKFDLTNSTDVYSCWFFCKELIERMEERAEETREEDPEEEQKDDSLLGPFLLLDFLAKMLERDFEIWWREWRRAEVGAGDGLATYPLFYYIFGGDRKNILKDLSKSVVGLYRSFLRVEHWALPQVLPLQWSKWSVPILSKLILFSGAYAAGHGRPAGEPS